MAERAFLDSNVLVYAIAGQGEKRARSLDLLHDGGVISAQVMNEVAHVLRRKAEMNIAEIGAAMDVASGLLETAPLTQAMHRRGLRIAQATNYSIWDASIVAAALETGCDTLWTEDMQDGRTLDGLLIRNPFAR